MKKLVKTLKPALLLTLLLLNLLGFSSENARCFQTVRGTIIDQDAKIPIIGANVIVINSNPIMGASTDIDGNFRIENVPVGRITLQVTYLGYEKKILPNIMVGSGKEVVLNIELVESIVKLDDITVKAQKRKQEALNEMATVSAKVFTVEETKRYAGSFNDPARMVANFAGVVGNPVGENEIIVRGNSPKGILWRLEGVEIPNPNHFANEGGSGGPINALNSAMLANSDFFSGAFAPEYGNAYSGVFDMKLRTGNNEKREYSFSAGALGIDGTVEGPFKKGYGGSYLLNYRYSSLAILDDLGLVEFYGVPKYQDLSFKVLLPTQRAGNFELFGLGGKSNILQKDLDETNNDSLIAQGDWNSELGVLGFIHTLQLNNKTYLKNTLSGSATQNGGDYITRNNEGELFVNYREKNTHTTLRLSSLINHKINAKHRLKAGLTYSHLRFNLFAEFDRYGDGTYVPDLNSNDKAGLVQGFVNWKYRVNDDLTLISGVHYMQLMLNNSFSVEPRLGIEYRLNPQQALTFGAGLHSKILSLATYMAEVETHDGLLHKPNKDLELSKALHGVVGYKHQFTKHLHLKTEVYYQHLYDVPVENDPESSFVLFNYNSGWTNKPLNNKGTGRNYGLEFTLERFYHNQFYFLGTASVYNSLFTAMDGLERSSSYNGNYTFNVLVGKEFSVGHPDKNRTIAINGKATLIGGGRYTPIDLEQSNTLNEEVLNMDEYLNRRGDNVFKADISLSYRRDREKTTHEFKIDLQNITNHQAVVGEYYNERQDVVEEYYQWAFFPNVIYTIQF